MYKLSVPIMFHTITRENIDDIVKNFKECKVDRVFITGLSYLFNPCEVFYSEENKWKVQYFKEQGFEVGIWLISFGHGDALLHETGDKVDLSMYTKIQGINKVNENSICPMDKNVIEVFKKNLKLVAKMEPDLIMFDDDYRLNYRNYRMGCVCEKHLQEYYKRIGEVIPKEELEKKIFSGGKNFYRTEWLKLQGETLINFSKEMRSALNEVNPDIRMSICACWDTWDFEGTNCIEIAKALGGDNPLFLRSIGAAYHNPKVSMAVEANRAQANWCKDVDIEFFSEGDVYPRPRYIVPARQLELFDLALISTNEMDGILKYMYDYSYPFGYETGYTDRHIRNTKIREELKEVVKDKKALGLRVIDVMAKTENWHLPDETPEGVSSYLCSQMENSRNAKRILTDNAIPTNYDNTESPVFIMGENAYYVTEEDLKNGAILDISAAKNLSEKGIDVGLISAEASSFSSEYFVKEDSSTYNFGNTELFKVKCSEKAEVETYLLPGNSVGSYRYENEKGQKFFVISVSLMNESYKDVNLSANYFSNYYRKKQLTDAIEYVSGKKMAVKTVSKNPDLYMVVLENGDKTKLTVSVINPFIDDAFDIEFNLAKEYKSIRFIGCEGKLEGDKVTVNYVEPYGFMAFEVKT
ncbi:MAG: hypothetical protein E7564_08000 [Ruminococcaceae bacterium]|nr:hypothetical protein [Oscillospiraceae bacterium]